MRAVTDKEYARNQCSLIIRIDGEEIEVPVCFGMTADEVKEIYPFILPMVQTKIPNPAIKFMNELKYGLYNDLSEEELQKKTLDFKEQTKFWYDKPEASLLELAIRFAVDIQLKGVSGLMDIFETKGRVRSIKSAAMSGDEMNDLSHYLKRLANGKSDESETQNFASVNLYADSGSDSVSEQLEEIEARLTQGDAFDVKIRRDMAQVPNDEEYSNSIVETETDTSDSIDDDFDSDGYSPSYDESYPDDEDDDVDFMSDDGEDDE